MVSNVRLFFYIMIVLTDAENITAVAHCATTPFLTGHSLCVHTKHAPLNHYIKQKEASTKRTHWLLDFPWWLPAHDFLFTFVPPDPDARKRTTCARKPIKIIAFTTRSSVGSWKDYYLQVNRLRHTSSDLVPA